MNASIQLTTTITGVTMTLDQVARYIELAARDWGFPSDEEETFWEAIEARDTNALVDAGYNTTDEQARVIVEILAKVFQPEYEAWKKNQRG